MARSDWSSLSLRLWGLALLGMPLAFLPAQSYAPETKLAAVPPPVKRVTPRPGNLGGKVMILMYHRIGDQEAYMVRSRANFRKDLARLYKEGYRPVTFREYITNTMPLPPGASPVVITFDDSHPSQIRFDRKGQLIRSTFVGEWLEFAKTRPDFPVKATFFANNNGPFGKRKDAPKAVALLQKLGSEIAAHTAHHVNLASVSPAKGQKDIVDNFRYLEEVGAKVSTFATPYGVWPRGKGWLEEGFNYKGRRYSFLGIVAAGAGPAHSPVSSKLRPMMVPRIKAYEGIQGLDWWLDKAKKGGVEVYVQP